MRQEQTQRTKVTELERRDLRAMVTGVGIILLLWCVLSGLGTLYMRAMEDRSWAEGRCHHAFPPNGVDSGEWQGCIRDELTKNPIEIAWPQMIGAAAGVVVVRIARKRTLKQSGQPVTGNETEIGSNWGSRVPWNPA